MDTPIIEKVIYKSWEADLDKVLAKVKLIVDEVEKVNINFGKTSKGKGEDGATKELIQVIHKYEQSLAKAKEEATKLRNEKAKLTREEKLSKTITESLAGSYNQLQAQMSLNMIKLRSLSEEQRKNKEIGGKLIAENKEINRSLKAIDATMGMHQRNVGNYANALGSLKNTMALLAAGAVAAGMAFISKSFSGMTKTALEEEKAMQRLSFAVKNVGSGSDSDIAKLNEQATRLMGIFDDEAIKNAAITMLNFGLTVNQVNQLLPLMVDAAAASGKSLDEMAIAIDKGINSGVIARSALGQLGLSFKDTGSATQNYAKIIEGLTKFEGGNVEAMKAQWGQMERANVQWGEAREVLGNLLTKAILPVSEGIIYLDRLFMNAAERAAASTKRIADGRLKDFSKYMNQQKDRIGTINEEMKTERNVYKGKQDRIRQINYEIAENERLGGAWKKNNKALAEERDGLQVSVNRSIAYVNALAGLRQELREGTGDIKLFSDQQNANTNTTEKQTKAFNNARIALEKLSQKTGDLQIDVGKPGFEIVPKEEIDGLQERLDKAGGIIKKFNDNYLAERKERSEQEDAIRIEEANKDAEIARNSIELIATVWDGLIERRMDALDEEDKKNAEWYDKRIEEIEALGLSDKETTAEKIAAEQYYQSMKDQTAEKEKQLEREQFILNQLAALGNIAIATAVNIAEKPALAPFYLTVGAIQAAIVAAQAIPQFAEGGLIKPLDNGRITESPNVPTRPSGDNIIAYVKRGETILNNDQINALGGAWAMKQAGVPGYEDARYIPDMRDIGTNYFGKNKQPIIVNANFESEKIVRELKDIKSSLNRKPKLMDELKAYRYGN
jgi:hypothetical protein